jgi:CxxC-x17-CxxC domain-containing protein
VIDDGSTFETPPCVDCGEPFVVTIAERMARRGTGLSVASRCPDCRVRRRAERNARMEATYATTPVGHGDRGAPGPDSGAGPLRPAPCAACGRTIRVPFRPRADRPLFCRACLNDRLGH